MFELGSSQIQSLLWISFFVVVALIGIFTLNYFLSKSNNFKLPGWFYALPIVVGFFTILIFLPFNVQVHTKATRDDRAELAPVTLTPSQNIISDGKKLQSTNEAEKKEKSQAVRDDLRKQSDGVFDSLWEKEKKQREESEKTKK